jgi:hypothetical protein
LIGQKFHLFKCSLAVYCLRCFWQCRQVVEVELIGCLVVKRRVRSELIVTNKVILQSALRLTDIVVGMQVDLFVFDTPPQSFHEHVVPPATFAIHADLDAVVFQQASKFHTGELMKLLAI